MYLLIKIGAQKGQKVAGCQDGLLDLERQFNKINT